MRAAIDCGTNSTRLLIVDDRGAELVRQQTVTGLGRKAAADGTLASESIARVADCMRTYRVLWEQHGSPPVRMVATAAARDAPNAHELSEAITEAFGIAPDVIAAEREAFYAFTGATLGLERLADDGLDAVLDIGGGSTEIAVGRPGEAPEGSWSVPIGSVRITEAFLHGDPPSAEELSQAVSVVHAHLDDIERELPRVKEATRLIGVAGSITTVAAVEIGLPAYDPTRTHRFVLTKAAAEDVFRTLATEKRRDRAFNPGLPADRVDTIVAGALILVTVLRHFGHDSLIVSETDILDGLVSAP